MTASITINAEQFVHEIQGVAREQFPFACANALSRTAEEAVTSEIGDLGTKFTLRNQRVASGFRVEYARKNKLVAEIQHRDPFMFTQEYGGEKTPLHTKNVAIPKAARPTPQSTTPRSKWPGHINRSFIIRKGDTVYEYARSGRRSRVRHKRKGELKRTLDLTARHLDPNLKLMYVLRPSVMVKPRLGMRERLMQVAAERFPINFAGMLDYALRTAK